MTLVAIKNHFTIYSHLPSAICHLPLTLRLHISTTLHFRSEKLGCLAPRLIVIGYSLLETLQLCEYATLQINAFTSIPRQPCAGGRTGIGSTASASRHNSR